MRADLVVHEDAADGQQHAGHVGHGHRVPHEEQTGADDRDPLGGVADGVRQRRHQVQHRERHQVLHPVQQAVRRQQHQREEHVVAPHLAEAAEVAVLVASVTGQRTREKKNSATNDGKYALPWFAL